MSLQPGALEQQPPVQDDFCLDRVQSSLKDNGLDAVLCALPSNVLLLSGCWPVMGATVAVATCEGEVHLVLPEDETEIASATSPASQTTFQPGSLAVVTNAGLAVREPLTRVLRSLGLEHARVGLETGAAALPASYLSQYHYGDALRECLADAFPEMHLAPADALMKRLRAIKSPMQLERLRISCRMAKAAYRAGAEQLRLRLGGGLHEPAAADLFHAAFAEAAGRTPICRSRSYFFCMSGPNSATASAAFARTRARAIKVGNLIMMHCNSQADGYWTDLTRTFCYGEPTAKQRAMRTAILEARAAALAAIAPGTLAREVDKAARDVMSAHGFAKEFKHATGHGVGFSAANHDAIPRIHPKSDDVLEEGMAFNVEPAAYFDGYGGMRHCDVVAVTSTGVELLTDFQSTGESLIMDAAGAG